MINGCAEKLVYVQPKLTYTNMKTLPKMSFQQLQCLSDNTRQDLLTRDKIMKEHIIQLESIIDSTH